MVYKYDFLVIGAGVAGMSYALKVARAKKVCPFYLHTDEVRTPEIRAKVRFNPTACNVISQQQAV